MALLGGARGSIFLLRDEILRFVKDVINETVAHFILGSLELCRTSVSTACESKSFQSTIVSAKK